MPSSINKALTSIKCQTNIMDANEMFADINTSIDVNQAIIYIKISKLMSIKMSTVTITGLLTSLIVY